jgi:membrane protein YdbS with pleckstrin-like domain
VSEDTTEGDRAPANPAPRNPAPRNPAPRNPALRNPALREPAHQVSPKAPWLWAAGAALGELVLLAILLAVQLLDVWDVPWWLWVLYAAGAVTYVVGMPLVRYRVHRWESTDTAVYTQTGWLARERRIAPMSRVQTVDFEQSAVSRLLGLASVTVTTASAAGPLVIDGIDKAVADRLVDDLTRRTEAEAGDAT